MGKNFEMQVVDILVGACAGLTARKIVKGLSKTFCDNQGLVVKIGTTTLGVCAAISFGVKGGSMFYHVRSGMQKAYRDIREITKEEEKEPEQKEETEESEEKDDEACYEHPRYECPENWLCFSSVWPATNVYTVCIFNIAEYGCVTVADVLEVCRDYDTDTVECRLTPAYMDNKYGWTNPQDFSVKKEDDGRFTVTHVAPRNIDILKQSKEEANGESET